VSELFPALLQIKLETSCERIEHVSPWQGCGRRKSQQSRWGDGQRQIEEMGLFWVNCGEEISAEESLWGWVSTWRFVHTGSMSLNQ